MCQGGVLLSKCSSLAHTHGWLSHTRGCDDGLPKERIINKRRTQTILDNLLTPTFFELSLTRWLCQDSLSFAETRTFCNIRFRFFDASSFTNTSKVFLSHCILARIVSCTAKKRVLFGPLDVDCDSARDATTLSLSVVDFVMVGSMWYSTFTSCCFCNGGVHVTFNLTLPPPIPFPTKDTLRVSCRSPSRFEVPRCYLPNSSDFRVVD